MVFLLRVGPTQYKHGSESVMLWQTEQARIFSLASRIASASARASSGAARSRENALEIAIHDVGVDVALRRMLEGSGEAADNFKAKTLPQPYGTLVGADHEVVLHRAESALPRSVQRMRAHRPGHATARR